MLHTPTSQPLFIRHKTAAELFEKEAAAIARMPDDDKRWPAQVLSELHKQLPFVSKYDVDIEMTRVEPESGYALGYAMLRNKTGRTRAEEQLGKPTNKLRVPVIVADRLLQPFHVFEIGGKTYPLTQDRVESAMMNPAMFDGASDLPGTQSLLDQIYPPFQHRQGYGMMSGDRAAVGLSKLSSAPDGAKVAGIKRVERLTAALGKKPGNPEILAAVQKAMRKTTRREIRGLDKLTADAPFLPAKVQNKIASWRERGIEAGMGALSGAVVGGAAGGAANPEDRKKGMLRGAAKGALVGGAAAPLAFHGASKLPQLAEWAENRGHKRLGGVISEMVLPTVIAGTATPAALAAAYRKKQDKTASGEPGPLREFLQQKELEKEAGIMGNVFGGVRNAFSTAKAGFNAAAGAGLGLRHRIGAAVGSVRPAYSRGYESAARVGRRADPREFVRGAPTHVAPGASAAGPTVTPPSRASASPSTTPHGTGEPVVPAAPPASAAGGAPPATGTAPAVSNAVHSAHMEQIGLPRGTTPETYQAFSADKLELQNRLGKELTDAQAWQMLNPAGVFRKGLTVAGNVAKGTGLAIGAGGLGLGYGLTSMANKAQENY